ncbi:hypothetical protein M1N41_00975 [Thermodesulfovibrionales bacterium]|nr:hypothetical protein [Thermodesulfovibrionales bacterium]
MEMVHQVLYCDTDWNEEEVYGRRFKKIIERSNLGDLIIEVDKEVGKEFKRRIERKLKGRELIDKSLAFYRILYALMLDPKTKDSLFSEIKDYSEECINLNLTYMKQSDLIVKEGGFYKLPNVIKKCFLKQK